MYYLKHFFKNVVGFTLIELLIAMGIALMLTLAALMAINPKNMVARAQDSRRRSDVHRIKIALEEYFNDNASYPLSLPFGQNLVSNGSVILRLPQDPLYPQESYIYITADNLPKWYTLFFKQQAQNSGIEVQAAGDTVPSGCLLPSDCLPSNFSPKWGCLISGRVDCDVLTSSRLPVVPSDFAPLPTVASTLPVTPTQTSAPTATPTLAPTPTLFVFPTSTLPVTPTLIPSLAPTPTGVGSTYSLYGSDNTWCYLSSNYQLSSPPANSYCQDGSARYYNYCDTIVNRVRKYLCAGTQQPDGSSTQVHCQVADFYCPSGYRCTLNACQRVAD